GGITALHPGASQKTLGAVWCDALQVHQHTPQVERHQQHVTTLAQAVCLAALGDQVRMPSNRCAGVPHLLCNGGGGLLALVLLGFTLVPGLLDTLDDQLCFQRVGWLAAAPSV